jgi:hypothetical protein
MNPISPRFILLCIVLQMSICLQAQNVFWAEDFSNGIPAGWSNFEVNNSAGKWQWDNDPTALIFFPQPPFASATAANGFVFFDSDAYNIPHDARLISTSVDCSNQSTVIIHFENQYDYFSTTSQAILEVSNDSLIWNATILFPQHPANDQREHVQIVELDISAVAANQANVYLRFRWLGHNEYIWRVDDIRLQNAFSPPIAYDVSIGAVALATNFRTPLAHAQEISLGGDVLNNGAQVAHNVVLNTSIIDTVNNTLVYFDTDTVPSIPAGSFVTVEMPSTYLPTAEGKYKIYYDVSADSTDQRGWNNQKIIPFEITNNLFQKNFEFSYTRSNVNGNNYEVGNIYKIKDSGHYANKIYFTAERDPNLGPLIGSTVDVKLYEISPLLDPFLSNMTNNDAVPVGFGSYTFTANDQNKAELVGVEVRDINNARVLLKPGIRYFAMVSFTTNGSSNDIAIGLDESWAYEFELATVIFFNNNWYELGFGSRYTAIVLLETTLSNGIEKQEEEANIFKNRVNLFPNPVIKEDLTIGFDLEKPLPKLSLILSNMEGKQVFRQTYHNIHKDAIRLKMNNYPKGIYTLILKTENNEQITKRFVVE